jgi:hypothetical protein
MTAHHTLPRPSRMGEARSGMGANPVEHNSRRIASIAPRAIVSTTDRDAFRHSRTEP